MVCLYVYKVVGWVLCVEGVIKDVGAEILVVVYYLVLYYESLF